MEAASCRARAVRNILFSFQITNLIYDGYTRPSKNKLKLYFCKIGVGLLLTVPLCVRCNLLSLSLSLPPSPPSTPPSLSPLTKPLHLLSVLSIDGHCHIVCRKDLELELLQSRICSVPTERCVQCAACSVQCIASPSSSIPLPCACCSGSTVVTTLL